MDIREAKEQIKHAVQIYLEKDRFGRYKIPVERQRPVFLLGAPGIGKTAIMEQISQETGLPLLTYSMTHHTRQSALGLPVIVNRTYQGEEFSVSEYTLSEIISALYQCMERTGKKEGILFLDEINCVSETLAPSMLQFLQYKTFGNHRIPDGWVIVTAGNPPQYNRSVREFDIVTLDRLKVMEIEPDYLAWQAYAREVGIHRAIQTFLDVRRDHFYRIENTRQGRQYVTARGWEDLSEALSLYEENAFAVDEALITQYIRHARVADEFITYYRLYCKYRGEYPVRDILAGSADKPTIERAQAAPVEERITVLELLLEALLPDIDQFMTEESALRSIQRTLKTEYMHAAPMAAVERALSEKEEELDVQEDSGTLTMRASDAGALYLQFMRNLAARLKPLEADPAEQMEQVRGQFRELAISHQSAQGEMDKQLQHLFDFVEQSWGTGSEMLLLVTELTAAPAAMEYIYTYGCSSYDRFSQVVQLSSRRQDLIKRIQNSESSGAPLDA